MLKKRIVLYLFFSLLLSIVKAQVVADTVITPQTDTVLRITNLNPYFTLHVDSMLSYQLAINKEEKIITGI